MLTQLYHYGFTVTRIIDGDTVEGRLDLGFKLTRDKVRIRLLDVKAPEIRGKEKTAGRVAMLQLQELCPRGSECVLKSIDDKLDSFGRILGEIWHPEHGNLNQRMIEWLLANPYERIEE